MPDSKFNKGQSKSRAKMFGDGNPILKMPSCDAVVKKAFLDCGVAMSGSMSLVPITWQELDSYCRLSAMRLNAWESDHVIMMSREYCSFINIAKSETCIQPYWPDLSDIELHEYHKSISKITEDSEIERDSNGNAIKN